MPTITLRDAMDLPAFSFSNRFGVFIHTEQFNTDDRMLLAKLAHSVKVVWHRGGDNKDWVIKLVVKFYEVEQFQVREALAKLGIAPIDFIQVETYNPMGQVIDTVRVSKFRIKTIKTKLDFENEKPTVLKVLFEL